MRAAFPSNTQISGFTSDGTRLRTDRLAISVFGQKNTQFFKTFSNSCYRLGEPYIVLRGTSLGQMVTACVSGVYATSRKNIGTWCKIGLQRAPCHQDFNAILRVTK